MQTLTNQRKAAAAETYEDYERLIYDVTWRFVKRRGGNFNDALSEANLAFLKAYETWQPSKSQFSTWLSHYMWWALMDSRRGRQADTIQLDHCDSAIASAGLTGDPNGGSIAAALSCEDQPDPVEGLFGSVTSDGREVLRAVLDAPAEVFRACIDRGGQPRNWRSVIREYLVGKGWSVEKVKESFAEISDALC